MRIASAIIAALSGFLLAPEPACAANASDDSAVALPLRYVTVFVKNHDEALARYTNVLGENPCGNVLVAESEKPQGSTINGQVTGTAHP